MHYADFYELKEIGSGGYRTVYTAKYKYSKQYHIPETNEYMLVVQYADNGSLLSYLDQNINKLTWYRKF